MYNNNFKGMLVEYSGSQDDGLLLNVIISYGWDDEFTSNNFLFGYV